MDKVHVIWKVHVAVTHGFGYHRPGLLEAECWVEDAAAERFWEFPILTMIPNHIHNILNHQSLLSIDTSTVFNGPCLLITGSFQEMGSL